ncbi:MAG: hypothetical protein R3B13_31450 [Polyangiaceae bacterium]
MPAGSSGGNSVGTAVTSDGTREDRASNGLVMTPSAADAAELCSKLVEAVRLLDAGDVAGARAVICAALRDVDDGGR